MPCLAQHNADLVQVHTVKVHNVPNEWKTAKSLFKLMVEVFRQLQSEWNVVVVTFTTDTSCES